MRKEVGRLERGEFLGDERPAAGESQNRSLRSDYRRGHTCAGAAGIALAGPAYHGRALSCELDRSIIPQPCRPLDPSALTTILREWRPFRALTPVLFNLSNVSEPGGR